MVQQEKKRVLLLEDDRIMADVLQRSLERAGLEATWASSGLAACEHLEEQFDVVVTDYQMPKMNGEEFVRRLRESSVNPNVPVIFVTGKGLELNIEKMRRELGVFEIIFKPFGPRHMIEVVRECLAQESDPVVTSSTDQ